MKKLREILCTGVNASRVVMKKLREILYTLLCVVLLIGVGIIIWQNKDVFLHKFFVEVEDTNTSKLVYYPIKPDRDSSEGVENFNKSDTEVRVLHNLDTESNETLLNNIIDTTGNIISYFSAIIAALALFAGIAMWKYYRKILTTEERIKELDKRILENALITLHAVPFVKATQITSSEHLDAIRYIANLAKKEEENINTDSKYAPLLLCQGLFEYFDGRYEDAIQTMKKAENLSCLGNSFRKVVSFHLARTYKQMAYYELGKRNKLMSNENKIEKYLDSADDYMKKAPSWLKDSLQLSIEAIRHRCNEKRNPQKTCFLARVFKGDNHNNNQDKFIELVNKLVTNKANGRYSFDRMTAIPLWLEIHKFSENDYSDNANDFVEYMKSRLQGQSGENILVSWYFSIARVLKNIGKKDEARIHLDLAFSYYAAIKNKEGIKTLFTYDCLTEISKEDFHDEMVKLQKSLLA